MFGDFKQREQTYCRLGVTLRDSRLGIKPLAPSDGASRETAAKTRTPSDRSRSGGDPRVLLRTIRYRRSQDGTRIVKDFLRLFIFFADGALSRRRLRWRRLTSRTRPMPTLTVCTDMVKMLGRLKRAVIISGTFIPASQRPDGTWRKQRRVKDGYIPQEEVPLYESKGKQLIKKPLYPVGASPEFIAEHKAKLEALAAKNKVIPGTNAKTQEGSKKKKKKNKSKAVEPVSEGLSKISISEPDFHKEAPAHIDKPLSTAKQTTTNNVTKDNSHTAQKTTADPQKRLKNLRKKIREIEMLEDKIKTGALKNPDKEIIDKVARKTEISKEIKRLEATL